MMQHFIDKTSKNLVKYIFKLSKLSTYVFLKSLKLHWNQCNLAVTFEKID